MTVTTKGGHARRLIDRQRRFASFTMTDPAVHDGAICVFTISEIRITTPTHEIDLIKDRLKRLKEML